LFLHAFFAKEMKPMETITIEKDDQALLTVEQAARRLNVSAALLNLWRSKRGAKRLGRHHLKFIMIGAAVRYDPRDIDEFKRSRTVDEDGTPAGVKRPHGGPGRPPKRKCGSVRNRKASA
jgi:hypothetical protein